MRRNPRISRSDASRRTKKAWVTRRRGTTYVTGSSNMFRQKHTWHRPSGEHVKMYGFSRTDIDKMFPAMSQADRRLRSDIRINTKLKKQYPYRFKGKRRYGALTVQRRRGSEIRVSPNAFKSRGNWDPSGLLAHELGHAVAPRQGLVRQNKRSKSYLKEFQWKNWDTPTRQSPIRKQKTIYQRSNAHEDFAETMRTMLGQDIVKRPSKRYNTYVNQKRLDYMYKNYIQ